MSAHDRVHWDEIYRARLDDRLPAPDPLLLHYVPPVVSDGRQRPPIALDLACGLGQNGLWLAEQGYTVDLLDVSRTALLRAQEEAGQRRLREVNFIQADLDEIMIERDRYDLVCVFRFLNRRIMSAIRAAVRTGGRIVYETYNTRHVESHPDFNPDYLLSPGELTGYFGDWRVLHGGEPESISQIVALKPERRP